MADRAQQIRKVQTAQVVDFDDQLWPINTAILILAGFVAGIVIAVSDFDNPNLLYNGWARLVSVAVMVAILLLGVMWLQGKMMRRLQLCILLSLLAHLWIAMYLHQQYLALMARREAEARQRVVEQYREDIIADHFIEQEEPESQQSFEEPIEHDVPRPIEQEPVTREPEETELETEQEPVDEPQPPQQQQVNPAIQQRRELSAPRRADAAAGGQISRQEWKHRPRPNEPIPESEVTPQPRKMAAAVPSANIAPHQQRQTEVTIEQRQAVEELASTQERLEVRMNRRATRQEQLPDVPTTPRPTRQITQAADIPRTTAATSEPVRTIEQSAEVLPTQADRMAARQQADAPETARPEAETAPTPTTPEQVVDVSASQRRAEQTPQLARAPRQTPRREPRALAVPRDVATPTAESQASTEPSREPARSVVPANVPRRTVAATTQSPTNVAQQATDLPVQPAPSAVAQNAIRRAQRPSLPSPQPIASRPARVTRQQQAPVASAAQVEVAEATAPAAPTQQSRLTATMPSTSEVRQIADRSVRVSQNDEAGQTITAMTHASQLPTAQAGRRALAQSDPAGASTSPARPSTLARSATGARLPSTAIASEAPAASAPAAAGASPASRVQRVASSAAVRHEGARPVSQAAAAAAGTESLAVGSSQVVARAGQARAVGTGEPSAAPSAPTRRIARATGPVASTVTSGVPQATATPTPGTIASTARGESIPSFNVQGSSARRGAIVRPQAQQETVGSGPVGSSGTPGPVEVTTQRRVTRYEAVESAIAGGGTPQSGRTTGGAPTPTATAEASEVASTAPSGGRASETPPLRAVASGAARQAAGLPGGATSQPMAGATAALTDDGAPLATAAARRAFAAGPQSGNRDATTSETVTMRRSSQGVDIPTATVAMEQVSTPGAGGLASEQGDLPSSLELGTMATVRRAAGQVSVGNQTAATGPEEAATGSAMAVALAGQVREAGDDVPAIASSSPRLEVGRTAAAGPATATAGPIATEAAPDVVASGPASDTATGAPQPASGAPAFAVAKGGNALTASQPSEEQGEVAGPEGGAVRATAANRAGGDDTLMAATTTAAVPGLTRTRGTIATRGTASAAPLLAETGPPAGGGSEAAPNVAAQASLGGARRQTAGLLGDPTEGTPVETAVQPGPAATTPGTLAGPRRLPQGEDTGPSLAALVGRAPLRRTDAPGLPRGVAEALQEQPIAAAAVAEPGEGIALTSGLEIGESSRQEGGLPVQVVAMAGPGGLGYDPSLAVGVNNRRARRESEIVHDVVRRFVIERSGGVLAVEGAVSEPTEFYSHRDPGRRGQMIIEGGGGENTEKAVEMGLDFFARMQFPDGHWSLHAIPGEIKVSKEEAALGQYHSDTAATGLALLTYLGAGYTHLDDKHRAIVRNGIDWLVAHQKPNGDLFAMANPGPNNEPTSYAWFYSHGIAAIALCEAYGMTQDPELREPARKAIDFIIQTQHPTKGGWRYSLDAKGQSTETDTSVTGWMLMALKSAQMAGLQVPDEVFAKIGGWLDEAQAPSRDGRYVYNPYALDNAKQREGRSPNQAMTAESMLMRMYLGRSNDDPRMVAGADYLKENLPEVGSRARPQRDCYYWYYATQVMFQMRGDYWTAWNERLRPLTESTQDQFGELAGSWHPQRPVHDRWGHAGGRLYVTALQLLMLEVYYRHLPLFKELSK